MAQVGMKYAASSAPLNVLIRQLVALNVLIHRSVDMPLPAPGDAPDGARPPGRGNSGKWRPAI
jgi:hypothetical protein